MTDFVVKISCMCIILGLLLSLLRDGGVKGYAKIGLGLVFSVCLLSSLLSFAGGTSESYGMGGLASQLAGRLENMLVLAEIKGDSASGSSAEIIAEYKLRLKQELESSVNEKLGINVNANFVVCTDIESSEFGSVEYVHCQIKDSPQKIVQNEAEQGETDISDTQEEGKNSGIDKIEITPDGVFIDGEAIGGNTSGSGKDSGEITDGDNVSESKKDEIIGRIFYVISDFCGVEREQCNIFWEE